MEAKEGKRKRLDFMWRWLILERSSQRGGRPRGALVAGPSSQVLQSEADFLTYYGERFPASQDVNFSPVAHPAEGLDLREDAEEVLRGLGIFPAQED
jgi:hypothetical protein